MSHTLTFKLQSFYVAYAPDAGAWSYGTCLEEAVNSLADQLRQNAGVGKGTDYEKVAGASGEL